MDQNEIFKPKKAPEQEKTKKKRFFNKKEHVAEANQFASDEKKTWAHYFQLPKRWVDVTDPFYFNVYRLKPDGLLFVLFALIIPFATLIITFMITPLKPQTWVAPTIQLVTLFCAIAGFIGLVVKDKKLAYSSGVAFYFMPIFSNLGIGLLLALIPRNLLGGELAGYIGMVIQMIITTLWIILIMHFVPSIGLRIKKTLKKSFLMLMIVSLVGVGLIFGGSMLLNLILKDTPLGSTSQNQDSLNELSVSTIGIVLLFVFTVIFAPLYEELIYRQLVYTGVGNRTVAFFVSAILFAFVHVQTGDLEHILPYLLSGFILSGIFNISRGNVTYSWMTHLFYNLLAFILMVVSIY